MTNDFKPDWDTVAAFNERISELEAKNTALLDGLRLLRVAIQTGYPEYGPEDWIDLIDTALAEKDQ